MAAATIAASSSGVGGTMAGRSDVFDIVLHLTTFGSAEADDSANLAIERGRPGSSKPPRLAGGRLRNQHPFAVEVCQEASRIQENPPGLFERQRAELPVDLLFLQVG
ncbi:MAG: hypothetical protein ACJ759_16210, partial [Thermoanaerobaculia bacterium]